MTSGTMTNREAIDILRVISPPRESKRIFDKFMQALDMAISALEKQESKKPLKMKDCKLRSPYSCPECYTEIPPGCEYCWRCGKKIDWSKEKEDD